MNYLFSPVTNRAARQRLIGMFLTVLILLSILCLLVLNSRTTTNVFAEANGTIYVVATNGSDSNPGTQGQPFATIQQAIRKVKAGDTIQVRGGTYHQQFRITTSGTAAQPITIMAYPGEKPILDGQYTLPEGSVARCNNEGSEPKCFTFNALVRIIGSHIRFRGFELTRSFGRGITIGNTAQDPSVDVIVEDCSIHDVRNNQIQVRFAENVLVQNCVAYHGSDYAVHDRPTAVLNWPSMIIALDADQVTFRGIQAYHNYGAGITAGAGSTNVTIEDNVIYDNIGSQSYVHRTRNVIIRRNFIYHTNHKDFRRGGNPAGCIALNNEKDFADYPYVKDIAIYDNVLVGCNKNIAIWNSDKTPTLIENVTIRQNTLVNAAANGALEAVNFSIACDANVRNIVVEKNIFYQQKPVKEKNPCLPNQASAAGQEVAEAQSALEQFIAQAPASAQIRYNSNLWWPFSLPAMTSDNDIIADPKLAAPDTPLVPNQPAQLKNYKPLAGSPAIAGGHGAQAIFDGTIGATATPGSPGGPTPTATIVPTTPPPTTVPTPRPTAVGCLPQDNGVVSNPGFEDGKSPWRFRTNGRGTYGVTSPGFECTNAAQLTIKRQGRNVLFFQKRIALEAGQRYRLSFYASSNSGDDLKVYLEKNGGNRANYGVQAMRADLTKQWRQFVTEFAVPNSNRAIKNARLRFWLSPYDAAGDEYWIDHVVLEKINGARNSSPPVPGVEVVELVSEPDGTASGATVSGYIQGVDKATAGKALEEVEVTLVDEDSGGYDFSAWVETDEDGYYLIEGIPAGEYTLSVTAPDGYVATPAQSIHVEGAEAIEQSYTLPAAVGVIYLPMIHSQ